MKLNLLQSILFDAFISISYSQIQYVSFGGYMGIGSIKGNSTPVTSLARTYFVDVIPWFSDGMISIRGGFLYAQKLEKFFPKTEPEDIILSLDLFR